MARRSVDVYTEWRGGTCRVKWWTGEYHSNGRKRFASQGGFLDEDTALKHGQDQLYEIRHGLHIPTQAGAVLMSKWLDDWLASIDLRYNSEIHYKWAANHIRAVLGAKAVADVSILDVRAFKKHLAKVLPAESSRGDVLKVLGMVMDDAKAAGLCKANPVERKRRRGKYKKKPRERKKDMRIEAVEQLARNAEMMFGYAGYVFIWTMAMTGMRPGELFGLTREYCYPNWPGSDPRPDPRPDGDDVARYDEDVERYGVGDKLIPAIRVERQVQYEEGGLVFTGPKYDSYRTLAIPPFLADMLEKLLASHDSRWVFIGIEGGCLAQASFNKYYWRPIADGCDARQGPRTLKPRPALDAVPAFRGKRMYLIRHGHKEWLDEDGHPRYVVESRMGHELRGVEGTYSNLTPRMERAVMAALQLRWETHRARVPEQSQSDRPATVSTSVAALIRAALDQGLTSQAAVLAEVRRVRPDATSETVRHTRARELRKRASEARETS